MAVCQNCGKESPLISHALKLAEQVDDRTACICYFGSGKGTRAEKGEV